MAPPRVAPGAPLREVRALLQGHDMNSLSYGLPAGVRQLSLLLSGGLVDLDECERIVESLAMRLLCRQWRSMHAVLDQHHAHARSLVRDTATKLFSASDAFEVCGYFRIATDFRDSAALAVGHLDAMYDPWPDIEDSCM